MSVRDLFDAVRHRRPAEGGDGRCVTAAGTVVDLELYKFDSCPFCQHVYRTVEQLGLPVRYRDIEKDAAAARRLVEVGGLDQVPCLFVDGKPMYESDEIAEFLERTFRPATS
jgi:glutaredoxin